MTCLHVCKDHRWSGVSRVLIDAAVKVAKEAHIPVVEAYPIDREVTPSATGTGYASTFRKEGFEVVARSTAARPIICCYITGGHLTLGAIGSITIMLR